MITPDGQVVPTVIGIENMKPKSTEHRQGRLEAIYNLLDVIHANNNQITLKDVEQFQEGQLLAQENITDLQEDQDFTTQQAAKKQHMQPAAEQALEQLEPLLEDQQDFGWLDEILFDPQTYYTLNTENEFVRAELYTDWVKADIQAHFTAMQKDTERNHQADLLRARIETLNSLLPEFDMVPMISGWKPIPWATMKPEDQKEAKEWQAIHSHAALYYCQFVKNQIEELQAELDTLNS